MAYRKLQNSISRLVYQHKRCVRSSTWRRSSFQNWQNKVLTLCANFTHHYNCLTCHYKNFLFHLAFIIYTDNLWYRIICHKCDFRLWCRFIELLLYFVHKLRFANIGIILGFYNKSLICISRSIITTHLVYLRDSEVIHTCKSWRSDCIQLQNTLDRLHIIGAHKQLTRLLFLYTL